MKGAATVLGLVVLVSLLPSDIVSARTPCQTEFEACEARRPKPVDCEQKFRTCVLRKCPAPTAGGCTRPRPPECEAHCTEAATRAGVVTSCCEGGPKHVNSCPNKIDNNCNPTRTGPMPGRMMPMMMPPMMGGGMPPMLPMIPMMPGGGGMMPPGTNCEPSAGLMNCPQDRGGTSAAITFTADPPRILRGESSTLTWAASNVTTCAASGDWSGDKATSGSYDVTPTATTTTYILTCQTSTGPFTQSVTVTIVTTLLNELENFADRSWIDEGTATFRDRIASALWQLAGIGEDEEVNEGGSVTRTHIDRLVDLAQERASFLSGWREGRGDAALDRERASGPVDPLTLPGASTFQQSGFLVQTQESPGVFAQAVRIVANWFLSWWN